MARLGEGSIDEEVDVQLAFGGILLGCFSQITLPSHACSAQVLPKINQNGFHCD